MTPQSKLDALTNRWVSKKLMVFIMTTVLLVLHFLTADQWYMITMVYLGGQHAHDALINWKHGPGAAQAAPEPETKEQ